MYQIEKISIPTLPLPLIVIHEVLQNSKDAIQKHYVTEGIIHIELDLRNERVTIFDNGKGFPFDLDLFNMGGTDKKGGDWKISGYMGIGLKAVLFSTKEFWLEAVHNNQKWYIKIDNARDYLNGDYIKTVYNEPVYSDEECYTGISYVLHENKVSQFINLIWSDYGEKVSNDLTIDPYEKLKLAIEWYFRAHCDTLGVNKIFNYDGVKNIKIKIDVLWDESIKDKVMKKLYECLEGHENLSLVFENKYWDFKEAASAMYRLLEHKLYRLMKIRACDDNPKL